MLNWIPTLALSAIIALGASLPKDAPLSERTPQAADAPAPPAQGKTAPPKPAPHLDQIKRLAGTWTAVDDPKQIVSIYRVTAGGSAVLETVFPGADHEMITMYYMDGKDLVLTHYCAMGNQPHMQASKNTEEGRLVFECQGGSNIKEGSAHMHRGEYLFHGSDRMRSKWTAVQGEKVIHEVEFELVRRKDVPSREKARDKTSPR